MAARRRTKARRALEAPAGLRYLPGLVARTEEAEFLARLEPLPFDEVRMRGVTARRRVLHYGFDYGYDSWTLRPTAPVPAWLDPLRERAAAPALAGVDPAVLVQALVARYPPGAGIGWHRDAPLFGPAVVGISLGGPCEMRFRRPSEDGREEYRLTLEPRSAYVLSGAARASWQHSIPAGTETRYSITFRTVRDEARRRSR